jgi:hypothetical protein
MTTYDVSSIGFYVLDILGRPVSRIPDGGRADYDGRGHRRRDSG